MLKKFNLNTLLISLIRNINISFQFSIIDLKLKYRRSIIGPFWFVLSDLVFIFILGLLYSSIFGLSFKEYLPYISSGYIIWQLISLNILESTDLFIQNKEKILTFQIPIYTYILRSFFKNLIVFMHSFVIIIFIIVFTVDSLSIKNLIFLPCFIILIINIIPIAFIVSLLGARFRDLKPIMENLIRILFFLTPVIWKPELVNKKAFIDYNILYHLVDIVRSPLIYKSINMNSVYFLLISGLILILISIFIYLKFKQRLMFWL